MKIIDYAIITSDKFPQLEAEITKLIAMEWQPLGSPFAKGVVLGQAMVKYAEPVEPEIDESAPTPMNREHTRNYNASMAKILGREGGLKGGAARAQALSPEERSAIASKAAMMRWAHHHKETSHNTQEQLLQLASDINLATATTGEIAQIIGITSSGKRQMVIHHMNQLLKKGFLEFNPEKQALTITEEGAKERERLAKIAEVTKDE